MNYDAAYYAPIFWAEIAIMAYAPVAYWPGRIPVRARSAPAARTRLAQWLTHKQGFD